MNLVIRGVLPGLKRKLLKAWGVIKPPSELERKLKGSTDIFDLERRIQDYERRHYHTTMMIFLAK